MTDAVAPGGAVPGSQLSGTGRALWFSLSSSWLLALIVDDNAAGRGVAAFVRSQLPSCWLLAVPRRWVRPRPREATGT
jgi:hypothetical protein